MFVQIDEKEPHESLENISHDEKRHYGSHQDPYSPDDFESNHSIQWNEMENALSSLISLGHEKTASTGALRALKDRRLSPEVVHAL